MRLCKRLRRRDWGRRFMAGGGFKNKFKADFQQKKVTIQGK